MDWGLDGVEPQTLGMSGRNPITAPHDEFLVVGWSLWGALTHPLLQPSACVLAAGLPVSSSTVIYGIINSCN